MKDFLKITDKIEEIKDQLPQFEKNLKVDVKKALQEKYGKRHPLFFCFPPCLLNTLDNIFKIKGVTKHTYLMSIGRHLFPQDVSSLKKLFGKFEVAHIKTAIRYCSAEVWQEILTQYNCDLTPLNYNEFFETISNLKKEKAIQVFSQITKFFTEKGIDVTDILLAAKYGKTRHFRKEFLTELYNRNRLEEFLEKNRDSIVLKEDLFLISQLNLEIKHHFYVLAKKIKNHEAITHEDMPYESAIPDMFLHLAIDLKAQDKYLKLMLEHNLRPLTFDEYIALRARLNMQSSKTPPLRKSLFDDPKKIQLLKAKSPLTKEKIKKIEYLSKEELESEIRNLKGKRKRDDDDEDKKEKKLRTS